MKLSKKTEEWLLDVAPPHIARPDSPNTFEDVKAQAQTGTFIVFDGGSEDTIFSERKYQYAYRAWHDSIHLCNNIQFGEDDELRVAKLQKEIALEAGISERDAAILRLDLELHIRHYYDFGCHPVRQTAMISDYLESGVLKHSYT